MTLTVNDNNRPFSTFVQVILLLLFNYLSLFFSGWSLFFSHEGIIRLRISSEVNKLNHEFVAILSNRLALVQRPAYKTGPGQEMVVLMAPAAANSLYVTCVVRAERQRDGQREHRLAVAGLQHPPLVDLNKLYCQKYVCWPRQREH